MKAREVVIDKGVPIPRKARGGEMDGKQSGYRAMEIGDSVFFPDGKQVNIAGQFAARAARWGWKFTTRTVPGGVRVWRME